ncbi:MAG: phosphoribosyltransferase [Planctomycetes bacterium]|nr:phosphoribosyltransferase [Planctomycetota bacterium]
MGRLRIISNSDEPFADRADAGRALAEELKKYKGKNTVVLGIPRGGLIIAREMAHALEAELDMVFSRKIGLQDNPELAIGSISEDGKLFLNKNLIDETDTESSYIKWEKERQSAEIARRVALYRKILPKVPLKGKTVIVTDDGIATGATMQASLWSARQEHPQKLIAAIPVGPEDTLIRLADDADEMICLRAPYPFMAVGRFYLSFDQIDDAELMEILKEESERKVVK